MVPTESPDETTIPAVTVGATGSRLETSPLGCLMLTTPRSTMYPANVTTPSPGARTSCPIEASRSIPRWPGPHGVSGRSKRLIAWNGSAGDLSPGLGWVAVATAGRGPARNPAIRAAIPIRAVDRMVILVGREFMAPGFLEGGAERGRVGTLGRGAARWCPRGIG